MKITINELKQIIKEEIEAVASESMFSRLKAKVGFGNKAVTDMISQGFKAAEELKKLVDRTEEGEKIDLFELESALKQVNINVESLGRLVKKFGSDSKQKMGIKRLQKYYKGVVSNAEYPIAVAVRREEGRQAAERMEDELRRNRARVEKAYSQMLRDQRDAAKRKADRQFQQNAADKAENERRAAEREEQKRIRAARGDLRPAGSIIPGGNIAARKTKVAVGENKGNK